MLPTALRSLSDPASVYGDLVRRVAETVGTRLAVLVFAVVSGVLVARALGPSGRGEYAVASTLAAIGAQIANMGMHAANTYYLAKDRALLPMLLGNSLAASALVGGSVGAVLVGIAWARPDWIGLSGMLSLLAGTAIPLYCGFTLLQNLFLGLYDTRRFNQVELAVTVGSAAAVAALYSFEVQSPSRVYGASIAVTAVAVFWMATRLQSVGRQPLTVSPPVFRRQFSRLGIRSYGANLIALLALRADILIVRQLEGVEAAGQYAIAVNLGELMVMLPAVTGTILFARLAGEESSSRRWQVAWRTAQAIGGLIAALGAIAFLVSPTIIDLLYGTDYLPAATAFQWLVPGIVFLSVNVIIMNFFAAEGMPVVVVLSPLVALLVKLGLGLMLIPEYGIPGASAAAAVSYLAALSISVAYLARTGRFRGGD